MKTGVSARGLAGALAASLVATPVFAQASTINAADTAWMITATTLVLLKYDDCLDVFGIHGIGGAIGTLLTGVFATAAISVSADVPGGLPGVLEGNWDQLRIQAIGVAVTGVWWRRGHLRDPQGDRRHGRLAGLRRERAHRPRYLPARRSVAVAPSISASRATPKFWAFVARRWARTR